MKITKGERRYLAIRGSISKLFELISSNETNRIARFQVNLQKFNRNLTTRVS